jgi:hypothetical protein
VKPYLVNWDLSQFFMKMYGIFSIYRVSRKSCRYDALEISAE